MRDKCYCVASKDGQGMIRVRAGKRPNVRTTKALQELFEAGVRHLVAIESAAKDRFPYN